MQRHRLGQHRVELGRSATISGSSKRTATSRWRTAPRSPAARAAPRGQVRQHLGDVVATPGCSRMAMDSPRPAPASAARSLSRPWPSGSAGQHEGEVTSDRRRPRPAPRLVEQRARLGAAPLRRWPASSASAARARCGAPAELARHRLVAIDRPAGPRPARPAPGNRTPGATAPACSAKRSPAAVASATSSSLTAARSAGGA